MTTSTVALPGVSKDTKGVRMVVLAANIFSCMPGSWLAGTENAILPAALA